MLTYEVLARQEYTKRVPPDWYLVLADVRGSTQAIRDGRYRDVNLVGAACIAAVRNTFPSLAIPYVFGGDGATFLAPAEHREQLRKVLQGVQQMAKRNLNLDLRVGDILVAEITRQGAEVRYGYLTCGPGEVLFFFRGSGVSLAESLLKQAAHTILTDRDQDSVDISGLSCRLTPFRSLRGQILSLLVEPKVHADEEDQLFLSIFACLKEDGPLERLRPIGLGNLVRPWLSTSWRREARLHRRSRGLWEGLRQYGKTLFESLVGTFLFRLNLPNPILGKPTTYTQSMIEQSDWIKMDGILRLVIDVTLEEKAKLHQQLEALYQQGRLYYGMHGSESAVMTCHFQSAAAQRHTHFIDGLGGGLSTAASELKRQRQAND